jgi:hypothetical protein
VIAALRLHGIEILSQEKAADPEGEPAFEDHDALLAIEYVSSDDTVSLYLKEMAVTPLLSLEQEVGLAKRIAALAVGELGRPNERTGSSAVRWMLLSRMDGWRARR